MNETVIYANEKSVLRAMEEAGIKEQVMFITAYVDHSNYHQWGFSVVNVNSDYYFAQDAITSRTKVFTL